MTYALCPVVNGNQYFLSAGVPLSGGLVYAYQAGTTTLANTYTDSSGRVGNTNPMVLNSSGRPVTPIWIPTGSQFDFRVVTPAGVLIEEYLQVDGLPTTREPRGLSPVYENGTAFYNNNGDALSAGLLYTYLADSNSQLAATWNDLAGTEINPNPIVLSSSGTLDRDLYLSSSTKYNFVLCEPNGTPIQTVNGVSPTAVPDPYFANVQLLAHFDPATGLVDNSSSPKTLVTAAGANISTAQWVFGGGSARSTTAQNSRIAVANPGCRLTGDFTVEFRLRMLSVAAGQYFFTSNWQPVGPWIWFYTSATGKLRVYVFGSELPQASNTIFADTWYAIALTRSGLTRRLFVDGVLVAQNDAATAANQTIDTGWCIGGAPPQIASGSGNCFIDEVRITNGIARYTSNYTVAQEPFPNQ